MVRLRPKGGALPINLATSSLPEGLMEEIYEYIYISYIYIHTEGVVPMGEGERREGRDGARGTG